MEQLLEWANEQLKPSNSQRYPTYYWVTAFIIAVTVIVVILVMYRSQTAEEPLLSRLNDASNQTLAM